MQSAFPNLSEQIILQCHFKWGLFWVFSFQKVATTLSLVSFVPDVARTHFILSSVCTAKAFSPEQQLHFLVMMETKQKQVFRFLATCERKVGETNDDDVSYKGWIASSPSPSSLLLTCWKHSVRVLSGKSTVDLCGQELKHCVVRQIAQH